jgi:hypothetical protein
MSNAVSPPAEPGVYLKEIIIFTRKNKKEFSSPVAGRRDANFGGFP